MALSLRHINQHFSEIKKSFGFGCMRAVGGTDDGILGEGD